MSNLIILKELHDNLLNLRFVVACCISIVLIIATIVVLTDSYQTELADFNGRQIVQEDFINHYGHVNRFGWMAKPLRAPARYAFLAFGIDREAQQENFLSNPMPVLFSQVDIVAIVTIIMSLMAILFSYNSISGEREAGMLKQMLSTNVSRSAILVGKFIGGSISLLIPFAVGLLAGLVFVSINPNVRLESVDLAVFSLLFIASCLYLSAFYALGMLFSARSQTSNVAVLKSIFAWVVLVLMLPNISPFLAAQVYRIPSKTKIDMERWTITSDERDKIVDQRTRELRQTKYADIEQWLREAKGDQSNLQHKADADPAFKQRYAQYRKDWLTMVNEINTEQQAKAGLVRKEFEERSKYQEHLASIFASVSPLANYVFIGTNLTETGIEADNHWRNEVERYFNTMDPILTDIYNKEAEKNPRLTVNDFIDLRGFPRFQHQPQRIAEKIRFTLPHFGMLVFFNVLFLAAAWVSFLRYDVR